MTRTRSLNHFRFTRSYVWVWQERPQPKRLQPAGTFNDHCPGVCIQYKLAPTTNTNWKRLLPPAGELAESRMEGTLKRQTDDSAALGLYHDFPGPTEPLSSFTG